MTVWVYVVVIQVISIYSIFRKKTPWYSLFDAVLTALLVFFMSNSGGIIWNITIPIAFWWLSCVFCSLAIGWNLYRYLQTPRS